MEPQKISLDLIDPNPWQTRLSEDKEKVEELSRDIKAVGMMQTPTARKIGERYQLAFGHTRLAAYRLLNTLFDGWDAFPLNIHDMTDEQMAIAAFNENEKRRDLNPVEKALAINKMLIDFKWTQQQVADKLRIDRSMVANNLRMLRLPKNILESIAKGNLPVRTAMALIPIYETTGDEYARLNQKFRDSFSDFMQIATNGEITSDAVRATVDIYMNFLHPEQLKLIDLPEVEPTVIASDVITATEELAEPRAPITAVQTQIEDWGTPSEGEQTSEEVNEPQTAPEEAESINGENSNQGSGPDGVENDEPQIPQVESKPAAVPAEKPAATNLEPADPNEILFTISYKTNCVIAGVKKPGWPTPKLKFLQHLTPNEVPALMVELGIN